MRIGFPPSSRRASVATSGERLDMELLRALAVLAEFPGPEHARLGELLQLPGAPSRAEHTELFEFQLWPYASVYLGPEAMLGGESRDRVAGFWRALQLTPPPEPDHLSVL